MEPAAFLNLDLDLRSTEDLGPFAVYLEDRAMVLYCGESNGEFQLTVEPLIGGHSEIGAEACTEELLNTLEAIPESMAKLLQRCHQRLFDYGFDGGFDAKPCSVDIPREQLSRAMRLGIGMRVTVYPYRSDSRIKKGEVDA